MFAKAVIFSGCCRLQRFIIAAFLLSAIIVLAAMGRAHGKTAPESFADLAEKLLPAVVNIATTQKIEGRDRPTMPKLPPGSPFEEFVS